MTSLFFERITASLYGSAFNNGDDENEGDSRSENKGPEPEALTVGQVGERTYAFIGLERMGGIFVYDITNPYDASFVEYINNRDVTEGLVVGDAIGDLAPESLLFVAAFRASKFVCEEIASISLSAFCTVGMASQMVLTWVISDWVDWLICSLVSIKDISV